MDLPATTTDNTLFSLQTARDFLVALQDQAPSSRTTVAFDQVLESTRLIADTFEMGTFDQTLAADPTASALFQAHSGSLSASQGLLPDADSRLFPEEWSQRRVTGIDASSAPGAFAEGRFLPSEEVQALLAELEPADASRYPAIAGAGDFTGIYDALRSAGRMNPPLGTSLDLKG